MYPKCKEHLTSENLSSSFLKYYGTGKCMEIQGRGHRLICSMSQAALRHIETSLNPFMDGSFSEWLACAESAPRLPSYLTAGAEQWNQTGPSLAAQVVLSSGAAMFAVPLSPRWRGGQTLRDTARFMPSFNMFLPRALRMHPRPSFRPRKCRKVARGCAPSNPAPKGGHPPLETPPVHHCFNGQCGRKSGHFFQEHLLSVHGRDGLSRPFPRLVRGSNEVGGAWDA